MKLFERRFCSEVRVFIGLSGVSSYFALQIPFTEIIELFWAIPHGRLSGENNLCD